MSGKPQLPAPSFDAFSDNLQPSSSSSSRVQDPSLLVTKTMNRAYRDHICDRVYTTRQMEPLQTLLVELHNKIRALVPHRTDLHSILQDDAVRATMSPPELAPLLLQAARALVQLESPVRSEMTQAWIQATAEKNIKTMDLKVLIDYLVTSILYLIFKADQCQTDKEDFYLSTLWAPQIRLDGPALERDFFQECYGNQTQTAPLTREWVRSLVAKHVSSDSSGTAREELSASIKSRQQLVQRGWVEDLLFRTAEQSSTVLPEILAMDAENLRSIRDSTRRAAAGSALALHACNAAGVATAILSEALEPSSPVFLRQRGIADAMASRHLVETIEEYEEGVASQVVALTKQWNPALKEEAVVSLKSRTTAVLRAEDPVIKILDSRMKNIFSSLVSSSRDVIPEQMTSGRGNDKTVSPPPFLVPAQAEFRKFGLSFYASDLARASWQAKKIIDLAWTLFGEQLIDRMVLAECQSLEKIS